MVILNRHSHIIFGIAMWAYIPWLAYGQSTSAVVSSSVATTTASSTSSTAATYSGTPYLVMTDVTTWVTCNTGHIYWSLKNEDPSEYNITLYVITAEDQTIPASDLSATASTSTSSTSSSSQASNSAVTSSSAATSSAATSTAVTSTAVTSSAVTSSAATSSAATSTAATSTAVTSSASTKASTTSSVVERRALSSRTILSINTTIVTQYANHGYGWDPVVLPQGRYYIYAYVDDGHGTSNTSADFSVVEGSDTSCLAAYESSSESATGTQTLSNGGSSSSTASSSTSDGAAGGDSSSSNGISGGAIAGIVIGVLAGVAAAVLLALFCLRRRRRQAAQRGFRNDQNMGMTHRRMISGSTAPSDPGHSAPGTLGVAEMGVDTGAGAGTLKHESSWRSHETKGSTSVEDDSAPVVLDGRREEEDEDREEILRGEDPFLTPNLHGSTGGFASAYTQPGHTYQSFRSPPASPLRDSRRSSNPIHSPTYPSSVNHTSQAVRSSSQPPGPERDSPPGSAGTSPNLSGAAQFGRTPSTRRKPVPSLGPELRGELARQASVKGREEGAKIMPPPPTLAQRGSSGSMGLGVGDVGVGEKRMSFKLMPDMPLQQHHEE